MWEVIQEYLETDRTREFNKVKQELQYLSVDEKELLSNFLSWYVENHDTDTNQQFNAIIEYMNEHF